MSARIAVLASGSGSNLEALFAYQEHLGDGRAGTTVLVASDRAQARALERARSRDVPTAIIADPADAQALDSLLREHRIDLVVLAGYLKLIPAEIVRRLRGRIMNVHPTLLPAFGGRGLYGLNAHRAVLATGVRVTGVSVHFVDEVYDHGPVVAQWPVPVLDGDTPESLAARVLLVEHMLFPRAVESVAAGRVRLDDANCVQGAGLRAGAISGFLLGPFDATTLATSLDDALGV